MRNMGLINWFLVLGMFLVCLNFVSACIDINSASAEELDELTGIGPVYAERIIDGRPFASVDDLIRVNGIGEKTIEKIKEQGLACVEGEESTNNEEDGTETNTSENEEAIMNESNGKIIETGEDNKSNPETPNENVINLNSQQKVEQTSKVIYESKNEKIKNKAIYFFAGFLILVIIALLIWR